MAVDWLRKQFRFGGAISVLVTDSTTETVATDEQAAARVIVLTGTLTDARTFVLPLDSGADWSVTNATSGGFSVTVKGPSGTGVSVPAAASRYVVSDGSLFRASPNPEAMGPIGGTTPYAGTFTALTLTSTTGTTLGWAPTANVLLGQLAKSATAASQAGNDASWVVQSATAGSATAGAAQGGSYKAFAGNAARLTSGDANGGGFFFRVGAGVGTGTAGNFTIEQNDGTVLGRIDHFGGFAFGETVPGSGGTVSIYQVARSTDAACLGLYLQSQRPFASATGTNRNPGDVTVVVPAPATGGTAGKISLQVSSTERARVVSTGVEYSGSVKAVDGTPPNFGRSAVAIATDANHTLTDAQMANHVLTVTSAVSLTATRDVIAPLVNGAVYRVKNITTGTQSIRIIGATGTGATIAKDATATVVCDGTNWDIY